MRSSAMFYAAASAAGTMSRLRRAARPSELRQSLFGDAGSGCRLRDQHQHTHREAVREAPPQERPVERPWSDPSTVGSAETERRATVADVLPHEGAQVEARPVVDTGI